MLSKPVKRSHSGPSSGNPRIHLVLASRSPRRQEMLAELGIPFEICASSITEQWRPGLDPRKIAAGLAKQKALACGHPESLVVAMDTLVVVGREILGKPRDTKEAARMLRMLSNRSHRVITGLALLKNRRIVTASETTEVCFRKLDALEIRRYVQSKEPFDKAGAYAIQGLARLFVKEIRGCYFNVVGFPIDCFQRALKRLGISIYDLMK